MAERRSGRLLNQKWNVGAKHALYRADGKWYHSLTRFPGALFDANGYVLFETRTDYERCAQLQIRQDVHAPNGIVSIPGYVAMVSAHSSDIDALAQESTWAAESAIEAQAGYRLTVIERRAIEMYAMDRAIAHFERLGFRVNDVSSAQCYDLSCWQDESELCVEVKGTASAGEQVVLTRNEVSLQASRALFICHSIVLADGRPTGGVDKVIAPWTPEADRLTVINLMYKVP